MRYHCQEAPTRPRVEGNYVQARVREKKKYNKKKLTKIAIEKYVWIIYQTLMIEGEKK